MEEIEEMDNRGVMQFLIDNGANVNAKNYFGFTPLHCAVIHRNRSVIDILIQAGTDINAKSCMKRTALHFAVSNHQPKKWKRILPSNGEGPDMWMVEKLLDQPGILVDVRDIRGDTPLMWAVMDKELDAMFALLRSRANPNIRNKDSLTPLHFALSAQNPCPFIAVALLMHRASVKIADKEGNTPIDLLVQNVINTQCHNFAYECLVALAFTHRLKKSQKQKLERIPELSTFFHECSMEVSKMKKDYITNGFSVFRFMLLGSDDSGFDNLFELYVPVIKILLSFKYPKYLLNILQHIPKTILCIIFELLNFSKSCEEMLDITDTDSYEDVSGNDSTKNVSDSESCENTSNEGGCEEIADKESFEGFPDDYGCGNTSNEDGCEELSDKESFEGFPDDYGCEYTSNKGGCKEISDNESFEGFSDGEDGGNTSTVVCENMSDSNADTKKSDNANCDDAYDCDNSLNLNNDSYKDVSNNEKCESISDNNSKDTSGNDYKKVSADDYKEMSADDYKEMSKNDDCKEMSKNDDYKKMSKNDDYKKMSKNDDYKKMSKNDDYKEMSKNDDYKEMSKKDDYKEVSKNNDCKELSADDYKEMSKNDDCKEMSKNDCMETSDNRNVENESDYEGCEKVPNNFGCENTSDISSCEFACDKVDIQENLETAGHAMTCDIDYSEVKSDNDCFKKMSDDDLEANLNINFNKPSDNSMDLSDALESKRIDCTKIEPRDFFSKIDIFSISKYLSRLDLFCLIVALSKGDIHECMESIRERDNIK